MSAYSETWQWAFEGDTQDSHPSLFKSLFAKRSSQAANSAVSKHLNDTSANWGKKGKKKSLTYSQGHGIKCLSSQTSDSVDILARRRETQQQVSQTQRVSGWKSPLFFGLVMLSDLTGVKRQVRTTRRSKMAAKIWDESPASMTPSKTKSAVPRRGSRVRTLWLLFGLSGWSRNRTNLLLPSRSSFSKLLQLWDELSDGSSSNS